MFDHIIGNEKAKGYLTCTALKGTIGNSLLFAGPDGIGKSLFAEAFAKLLICQHNRDSHSCRKLEEKNHPDIHIYRPEGKTGMHSIAAMRAFSEEVYLAPFEAKWKIFIILEADRMLTYSAHALLKTFEEPSEDAIILLVTSYPTSLLPAVLSRCRTIHFRPLTHDEIVDYLIAKQGKTDGEAHLIASLAHGSIGHALRVARIGKNSARSILLDLLAKGSINSYKQLAEAAASIVELVERGKNELDAEVRKSLFYDAENFSMVQKEAFEKEIEGAVSVYEMREAIALFDTVLSWHRDMHLLHLNGRQSYLLNKDYAEACEIALERGGLLHLECVQKFILEARLMLERSTSLQICLENLFLKLNLL